MSILPDLLEENLKVVFCGTSAGSKSAKERTYYADNRNKFWRVLCQVGLTPRVFQPNEYKTLLQYGIGLTDLAKDVSGTDSRTVSADFDVAALRSKMREYAPQVIAFNGKQAAKAFYHSRAHLDYGLQPDTVDGTAIFVLPSTSGVAGQSWDVSIWHELKQHLACAPLKR